MSDTVRVPYQRRDWVWLFLKGMAMGAADVVPGVSGGTIAFISGIYQRLLVALKSLNPTALGVLFKQGIPEFWKSIDGWFLLTLFSGVLLSIALLANVINRALEGYPILVWSFFFGLVVAAGIYLIQQIPRWRFLEGIAIIVGIVIAVTIASLRPAQLPGDWWMVMIAGSIAICAMILPGISGSFILLLMGMYKIIIEAVQSLDIVALVSFASGCIMGLLGFSHLLSWLLAKYETIVYALLTGILIGSLNVLWPWKQVHETIINRHGETIPMVQSNILPSRYSELSSEPAYLLSAMLCALFGLVLVLLLERIGRSHQDSGKS